MQTGLHRAWSVAGQAEFNCQLQQTLKACAEQVRSLSVQVSAKEVSCSLFVTASTCNF